MKPARGFAAIIIVAIIALVFGAAATFGYQKFIKKTPAVSQKAETQASPLASVDETANWKTYTNSKYGFSLKYPEEKPVEFKDSVEGKQLCANTKGIVDIKIYPADYKKLGPETEFLGDLWVSLSVADNVGKISPEDYVKKACPDYFSQGKIGSIKNTEINGNKALEIIYKNVMAQQEDVVVTKGDKLFFIHHYSNKLPNPLFNQILSTFKFTSDETANWKTYTNEEAKFQIKYPPAWKLEYLDKWQGNPDSTLSGKEGSIDFIWGSGLGGACSVDFEKIRLKDGDVPACHLVTNTKESWGLFRPKGVQADTYVVANPPTKTNRNILLEILSTYEAIK